MSIRPVSRGLHVCELLVTEKGTNNISPINCFTRTHMGRFPSAPQRFGVYSLLSGALGSNNEG